MVKDSILYVIELLAQKLQGTERLLHESETEIEGMQLVIYQHERDQFSTSNRIKELELQLLDLKKQNDEIVNYTSNAEAELFEANKKLQVRIKELESFSCQGK